MQNLKIGWINVTFSDLVIHSKTSEDILDLVELSWKGIDQAMRPIIGKGGIEALFHRSIEITAEAYPWLTALHTDAPLAMDLHALRRILSKQGTRELAGASDILLVQFHNLLTNLIGLSLTDRLLRPVLDPLLNGPASKDI